MWTWIKKHLVGIGTIGLLALGTVARWIAKIWWPRSKTDPVVAPPAAPPALTREDGARVKEEASHQCDETLTEISRRAEEMRRRIMGDEKK